jgi:hypothetical protein
LSLGMMAAGSPLPGSRLFCGLLRRAKRGCAVCVCRSD